MKAGGISGAGSGIGFVVTGSVKNAEEKKESQVKNGTIQAGNLFDMENDRVSQKREEARKKAGKVITDQFARDNVTTDQLKEMRDKVAQLKGEIKGLMDSKKEILTAKEALKTTYGIDNDSQEQKDLELIEKAQDLEKQGKLGNLTKEELDRLDNLPPLTEYQTNALVYKEVTDYYDDLIGQAKNLITDFTGAIRSTKGAMLKQHGMTDAMKAADQISAAASDAVIGMLMEEARKKVEEELQKLVEAAKEAAKKKEEEEQKLEESKAQDKEAEKLTEEIQDGSMQNEKLTKEMDQILKELELEEDKKGLVIDSHL